MRRRTDDTGRPVELPETVSRVVSIVPSLTEAVAVTAPGLLVGATDWCTHPVDLDVPRVRGPVLLEVRDHDIGTEGHDAVDVRILRAPDLEALRAAGLPVWVTDVRTLDGAFGSLERMLAACGLEKPAWLDRSEAAWSDAPQLSPRRRAVVPVWRRPWMAVGSDTFAGDVLARLGVDNALDAVPFDPGDRYPRIAVDDLPPVDLVVLPDEPYRFTADDGPEAFPGVPAALVSGRHLTWYGPSLVEAPSVLLDQLRRAR